MFIKKNGQIQALALFFCQPSTQSIAMLKFLPCYRFTGCLLEQVMILRSQLDTTE